MKRVDFNLYCRVVDLLPYEELSHEEIAILCRCDVAIVSYINDAEFGDVW